ncbi:MAG: alpha-ketoglutarate-dependent dioxygenase AlkB, partial [Trebonia sp.]
LVAAKATLDAHYRAELGEPFRTAGLCLYRDGRDSVAWHGDTIGRGSTEDTMVAILSLGAARPLLLRPRAGANPGPDLASAGPADLVAPARSADPAGTAGVSGDAPATGTLRYNLGHGDLIVMGGSCQRTWEHAVPKTAHSTGARISVQFRPRGVR